MPSPPSLLTEAPATAVDLATRTPRFGTYRGTIARVELGPLAPDRVERLARHKRWVWVAITRPDLCVVAAVVDLGYVASAFTYVWTGGTELLFDSSHLAAPGFGTVRRTEEHRFLAQLHTPMARFRVEERAGTGRVEIRASTRGLELRASGDARRGGTPITVVAPIERGVVNVTEKHVRIPVTGSLLAHGRAIDLDGCELGYDLTDGLLARKTRWNWAFFGGASVEGPHVALNLVEGFVGAPECCVWIDGAPHLVGEGRFTFDKERPRAPWTLTSTDGAVDLRFAPAAVHEEAQDLKVVRSKFIQPVGRFSGTLTVHSKTLRVEGIPGVVEDQDVVW